MCMPVCMDVCICHILKSNFISHLIIKISSPHFQRIFMAVKTFLKKIMVLIKKNNMATIADCSKIIDNILNLKHCS